MPAAAPIIREDDLTDPRVLDLLRMHVDDMQSSSPPGTSFALDGSELRGAGITVWTVWIGNDCAGIGALKRLDDTTGEIKSMRTNPAYLRRGIGSMLLERIIDAAREHGLERLSLETGTGGPFEAALGLYRRRGFVEGEPFGDYRPSDFNRYFHLAL